MKKLLMAAVVLAALCASCTKMELCDNASEQATNAKDIQFVLSDIQEDYATRATISELSLTDLYIFEGTTLLKHQTSSDTDFGSPVLNLTFGSHSLIFIASNSSEQSFSEGVWSTTKVSEVFAATLASSVTASSTNTIQVQLKRRSSKIRFTVEDAIPSAVSKCHIKVANHKSLNAVLASGTAYDQESTVDVSAKHGTKGCTFNINTLTASLSDEEDCYVLIEFLSSTDAVLYKYERTVKLKTNRCTNIHGKFFDGSTSITIDNTWLDQLDVDLNGGE